MSTAALPAGGECASLGQKSERRAQAYKTTNSRNFWKGDVKEEEMGGYNEMCTYSNCPNTVHHLHFQCCSEEEIGPFCCSWPTPRQG